MRGDDWDGERTPPAFYERMLRWVRACREKKEYVSATAV